MINILKIRIFLILILYWRGR